MGHMKIEFDQARPEAFFDLMARIEVLGVEKHRFEPSMVAEVMLACDRLRAAGRKLLATKGG